MISQKYKIYVLVFIILGPFLKNLKYDRLILISLS